MAATVASARGQANAKAIGKARVKERAAARGKAIETETVTAT